MSIAADLVSNSFFNGLTKPDYHLLKSNLTYQMFEQHHVLHEPGSDVKAVYFPAAAILSVVTVMENGQGVEVCTVGHESAFGFSHALGSPISTSRVVFRSLADASPSPRPH